MNLYAETSAVLSWLLAQDLGESARSQLTAAAAVSTSDLTLIECDRTLRRAVATGRLTAGESAQLQALVDTASAHWTLYGIDAEIVHRSRRAFPPRADPGPRRRPSRHRAGGPQSLPRRSRAVVRRPHPRQRRRPRLRRRALARRSRLTAPCDAAHRGGHVRPPIRRRDRSADAVAARSSRLPGRRPHPPTTVMRTPSPTTSWLQRGFRRRPRGEPQASGRPAERA